MGTKRTAPDFYYYAGGKRQNLEVDPELVAFNASTAAALDIASDRNRSLPGGVRLVAVRDLGKVRGAARAEGQPVFRADGATIVVLPEVRVELASRQATAVERVLAESGIEASVEPHGQNAFVVRPKSGQGVDALKIANLVEERLHPPLAQARFVRVVPRPKP